MTNESLGADRLQTMTSPRPRPVPAAELPTARVRDARGALAAVVLHALLVLLALVGAKAAAERFAESSREADFLSSMTGGGGGGGPRAVYIGPAPSTRTAAAARPTPAPVAQVAPPRPVEKREPEPVPETPVPASSPTAAAATMAALPAQAAGSGSGTGGGTGSGVGSGTGSGVGAGSGTGTGGGAGDGPVRAPVWRSGALPFEPPPKHLRGRTVAVTFWVRADGRVEKIEVAPALPAGDYARRFEETLLGYRFQPARTAAGAAVAATTTLDIQLPSK